MGDLTYIKRIDNISQSGVTSYPKAFYQIELIANDGTEENFKYSLDGGVSFYQKNITSETVIFTIDATMHGLKVEDQSMEQGSDVIIREVCESENPFVIIDHLQKIWWPDVTTVSPAYSKGYYDIVGNMVFAHFAIEFDTSASSSDVIITGLPHIIQDATRNLYGGCISLNTIGQAVTLYGIGGTSTYKIYNINGSDLQLSDVSEKTIRGTIIYRMEL